MDRRKGGRKAQWKDKMKEKERKQNEVKGVQL